MMDQYQDRCIGKSNTPFQENKNVLWKLKIDSKRDSKPDFLLGVLPIANYFECHLKFKRLSLWKTGSGL